MEPIDVVRRYAAAWQANDITTLFDLYHDEFVLHYFGTSALAGDHVGKPAAVEAIVEATQRTSRQLDTVEDVLGGSTFVAMVARERLGRGEQQRVVRRVALYRVRDDKLAECWLYDQDQRFIDTLWSTPTPGE